MSVGAYLKTVSSYLTRASQAKRKEADDHRRDISLKEQEMKRHVDDLERQKRERQALLVATDIDPTQRVRMVQDIRELDNHIADARRQFEQMKGQITQEVGMMEDQARTFQSQADDFVRKADFV